MDIIIEATNEYQVGFIVAFISAQAQGPATETWSEKFTRMTSLCDETKRLYEQHLSTKVRRAGELAKLSSPSISQRELQEGQQRVMNDANRRFDKVIQSAKWEWKKGIFVSHSDLEQKRIIEEILNLNAAAKQRQESAAKADANAKSAGSSAWREMYTRHAADDRAEVKMIRAQITQCDATLQKMRQDYQHKSANEETSKISELREIIKGLEYDAARYDANARGQRSDNLPSDRWVDHYVEQATQARAEIKKVQKQIMEYEVARCKIPQGTDIQSNPHFQNILPGSWAVDQEDKAANKNADLDAHEAKLRAISNHPSGWDKRKLLTEYLNMKKQLEEQEEGLQIKLAEIESLKDLAWKEVESRHGQFDNERASMKQELEEQAKKHERELELKDTEIKDLNESRQRLAWEKNELLRQKFAAEKQFYDGSQRTERMLELAAAEMQRLEQMAEQLAHENENLQRGSVATRQQLEDYEKASEVHKINLQEAHGQREEAEKDAQRKQQVLENQLVNIKLYWETHVKEQELELTQRKVDIEKWRDIAQQLQVAQRKEVQELREQLEAAQQQAKAHVQGMENMNFMLKEKNKLFDAVKAELEQKKQELDYEKKGIKNLSDTLLEKRNELEAKIDELDDQERELLTREKEVQQLQERLATAQDQAHYRVETLEEELKLKDAKIESTRKAGENTVDRLKAHIQELDGQIQDEKTLAERHMQRLTQGMEEERKLKAAEIENIRETTKGELERMEAQVQKILETAQNDAKEEIEQQDCKEPRMEEELVELEVDGVEEKLVRKEDKSDSEDGDWEQVEKEVEGVKKDVQSKAR